MKILFLSPWFPYPPINGAKIRIYNLIQELAKFHDITLLAFSQTIPIDEAGKQIPQLKQYCKEVMVFSGDPYNPRSPKGLFSLYPRSVVQMFSKEFAKQAKALVRNGGYDVVIASEVGHPGVVSLVASNLKGLPIVLDALEVAVIKEAYHLEKTTLLRIRKGVTWYKLFRFMKVICKNIDACTVPSSQEKKNLEAILPNHPLLEVIPHSLNFSYYNAEIYGDPTPNTIVFTGSFTYSPNLDAVHYFLSEIFPDLKLKIPGIFMNVIGSTNGFPVNKFSKDGNVMFLGLLQDVRPAISKSWLSIVPLRVGAGTRLKIIESMALGTPVVSTSKGAEGLEVTHGKNILIADEPQAFANAVERVLRDGDLRQSLSKEGRKLVAEKYNSIVIGRQFNALLEKVLEYSSK